MAGGCSAAQTYSSPTAIAQHNPGANDDNVPNMIAAKVTEKWREKSFILYLSFFLFFFSSRACLPPLNLRQ
jgi:hypothetical protein